MFGVRNHKSPGLGLIHKFAGFRAFSDSNFYLCSRLQIADSFWCFCCGTTLRLSVTPRLPTPFHSLPFPPPPSPHFLLTHLRLLMFWGRRREIGLGFMLSAVFVKCSSVYLNLSASIQSPPSSSRMLHNLARSSAFSSK